MLLPHEGARRKTRRSFPASAPLFPRVLFLKASKNLQSRALSAFPDTSRVMRGGIFSWGRGGGCFLGGMKMYHHQRSFHNKSFHKSYICRFIWRGSSGSEWCRWGLQQEVWAYWGRVLRSSWGARSNRESELKAEGLFCLCAAMGESRACSGASNFHPSTGAELRSAL